MCQQMDANREPWDLGIIGGGATGLGIAVDAASRGLRVILFEQRDFAKGTSSRSTKLIHGGVRYLQQGNIRLVMEALRERGILRRNAPHLVKNQSFIIPQYKWWEGPFYGIGLKVYDWMSGSLGLGPSRYLSLEETLELAPTLDPEGLRGGVLYHDGQFDDARLAINLAQTAADLGAVLLSYFPVTGLKKSGGRITAIQVSDFLSEKVGEVPVKVLVNATGVFADEIMEMDEGKHESIVAPSQGVHIVLEKSFLPGRAAILVPHTDDGRVLFAVPWHDRIIVGTTDTLVDKPTLEPVALSEEIDFILQQIGHYLAKEPQKKDIRSVFAGLRPLVKNSSRKTAELSRDHLVQISSSGLITVTGGKWTTYRRMAQDVVDMALREGRLGERPCVTQQLPIHGAKEDTDFDSPLYYYGQDRDRVLALQKENPSLGDRIHPDLPYIGAEILWATRNDMCMTVEDALSRRTRSLLLDARAASEAAPLVAHIMAVELRKTDAWEETQVREFRLLANNYLPEGLGTGNGTAGTMIQNKSI